MELEKLLYEQHAGQDIGRGEIRFRCPNGVIHNTGDSHPSCRFNTEKRVAFCDVCKYSASESKLIADLTNGVTSEDKPEAVYHYTDDEGNPLYDVVRHHGKRFSISRGSGPFDPTLYLRARWRGVRPKPVLLILEGEKDCDTATELGYYATTNPNGAGKWRDHYAELVKDFVCYVIPDSDTVGIDHARAVVRSIDRQGGVAVYTGALPRGAKDFTEFFEDGGTKEALDDFLRDAYAKWEVEYAGVSSVAVVSAAVQVECDGIRKEGYQLDTGIEQIDDTIGGLRKKNLYVIGGYTSQGKTALALNIAFHNTDKGKRVLYLPLENAEQIPIRRAAMKHSLPLEWFIKPHKLKDGEYASLQAALKDVESEAGVSIHRPDSINSIRRAIRVAKPDLVVFDYIQRFASRVGMDSAGRLSFEIGKTMSELGDIAIDHDCAMMVLSQFKRREGDNKHRKPTMSDLKESGEIENYADNVLLLYWPWRDTLDDRIDKTKYEICVAKNKLGEAREIVTKINPVSLRIGG